MITFDLSDLEISFRFCSLTPRKRAAIMLLLNINNTYHLALSHLTLGDLERSQSWSLRFLKLICRKGAEIGNMLLLNINRKSYIGRPTATSEFDSG